MSTQLDWKDLDILPKEPFLGHLCWHVIIGYYNTLAGQRIHTKNTFWKITCICFNILSKMFLDTVNKTTNKIYLLKQLKYISNNFYLQNTKANQGGRETNVKINYSITSLTEQRKWLSQLVNTYYNWNKITRKKRKQKPKQMKLKRFMIIIIFTNKR